MEERSVKTKWIRQVNKPVIVRHSCPLKIHLLSVAGALPKQGAILWIVPFGQMMAAECDECHCQPNQCLATQVHTDRLMQ